MKLEWIITSGVQWKFVSPMPRCYAIIANQKDYENHKMTSLKNLSSRQAYQAACSLLNNESFSIQQIKRVNKRANTDKKVTLITFHPT